MQLPPDENLHYDSTADIGQQPTEATSAGTTKTQPTAIGHYHLLQKIGEGGMGEVWLAEQKEPVRRRVAVKLVKAGMSTREVICGSGAGRASALFGCGTSRHNCLRG
jgi:hypothetical protein